MLTHNNEGLESLSLVLKTFKKHAGRPGHQGGSLPQNTYNHITPESKEALDKLLAIADDNNKLAKSILAHKKELNAALNEINQKRLGLGYDAKGVAARAELKKKEHDLWIENDAENHRVWKLIEDAQKSAFDIVKVKNPTNVKVEWEKMDKFRDKAVTEGIVALNQLTEHEMPLIRVTKGNRGQQRPTYDYHWGNGAPHGEIHLVKTSGIAHFLHEAGHHIEQTAPLASYKAQAFLEARTAGNPEVSLAKLDKTLDPTERGKFGNFVLNAYAGKIYPDGSTEIISAGIEDMFIRPIEFAQKDPDYFHFMYNVLRKDAT